MNFIIAAIIVWSIAFVVIASSPRNNFNRWFSIILFTMGSRYFSDFLLVVVVQMHQSIQAQNTIIEIAKLGTQFSLLFYPIFLFLFSLSYTKFFATKARSIISTIVLLLPVIFMIYKIPRDAFLYPTSKPTYSLIAKFATIFIFSADATFVTRYLNTLNLSLKKRLKPICKLVVPLSICGWIINYALPILGIIDAWRFNIIIILVLLFYYLILISRDGIFGLKLKLEVKKLDKTLDVVTGGYQILNHAIKNEIIKIQLCSENTKVLEKLIDKNTYDAYLKGNIDNILDSSQHLMGLVKRTKDFMSEINLNLSDSKLSDIIEDCINSSMVYFKHDNIKILRDYEHGEYDYEITCDKIHIKEVINNIIKNSIESMDKQEKKINIKIYRDNKCIHVEIQDNGCGIKKGDLSYVINPFFTTKKNKFNFGLGLAYCDNVMQKHGGSFEIKSEYGIGTLICLKFPLNKKQRSSKISLLKKGYIYEQNQNCDSR